MNNIQRKFPMYWWTPVDLRELRKADVEEAGQPRTEKNRDSDDAARTSWDEVVKGGEPVFLITRHHVHIPDDLALDDEERAMLEVFRSKLQPDDDDQKD